MKTTIRLSVTKEEVDNYKKGYQECNEWLPTEEEVKQHFIEQFIADKHEYICEAEIGVDIV